MTRVLVDLLFMDGRKGGMELYAKNLYERFNAADLEVVGLASTELAAAGAPWFPGEIIASSVSGADRRSWAVGEVLTVGAAAKRIGADLIHSPANFGPWWGEVPVVLTLHDLQPFRLPELSSRAGRVIRALVRRSAAHATRILTDSQGSRDDIAHFLHPRATVEVIPLAGDARATAGPAPSREPGLLLALGNRLAHKNFGALVEAIALIPEAVRPRLVIAGGNESDPLRPLVTRLGLGNWVDLLGWLSADEIDGLYARATAVVIPTLFEGFGLPVLEGMSRGCPVICSELPVLREVGGDAAAYFDPHDIRSIADVIVETLRAPDRLAELARLGLERARRYSWAATAAATAAAFRRALDGGPPGEL